MACRANAVACLSGDDSRFITGQSLLIEGGRWMICPAGQGAGMRVGIKLGGTFADLIAVGGSRGRVPGKLRECSATPRKTNRMEGYATAA